jgi:hypothetical protein
MSLMGSTIYKESPSTQQETKKEGVKKTPSWADLSCNDEDEIPTKKVIVQPLVSPAAPAPPSSTPSDKQDKQDKPVPVVEAPGFSIDKKERNQDVMNKESCIYFSRGYCRYGNACFYSHDSIQFPKQPTNNNNEMTQDICRYFNTRQGCNRGDQCTFLHAQKPRFNGSNGNGNGNTTSMNPMNAGALPVAMGRRSVPWQKNNNFGPSQGQARSLHKCPNTGCTNMCLGKQCSRCHQAMVLSLQKTIQTTSACISGGFPGVLSDCQPEPKTPPFVPGGPNPEPTKNSNNKFDGMEVDV